MTVLHTLRKRVAHFSRERAVFRPMTNHCLLGRPASSPLASHRSRLHAKGTLPTFCQCRHGPVWTHRSPYQPRLAQRIGTRIRAFVRRSTPNKLAGAFDLQFSERSPGAAMPAPDLRNTQDASAVFAPSAGLTPGNPFYPAASCIVSTIGVQCSPHARQKRG